MLTDSEVLVNDDDTQELPESQPDGSPLVSTEEDSRRRPYHYSSPVSNLDVRYRYYTRLGDMRMPDHVVPPAAFVVVHEGDNKQSSLITILSMWNTMVGASLLSLPWAMNEAGVFGAVCCLFLMGTLCFYTAFRIVRSVDYIPGQKSLDFTETCTFYFGRCGYAFSVIFSQVALFGTIIVYFVLMTNFLFYTGSLIHGLFDSHFFEGAAITASGRLQNDANCSDYVLFA